jgi:GT2 family glycosyltransferase
MSNHLTVSVLMACHNRKNLTLKCLESLYAAKPENWALRVYLVDDGSNDGTSEAVQRFNPNIKITTGPGTWYWAHSMYQAEISIDQTYDAILWLNDDTELFSNSLEKVSDLVEIYPDSILVGQFREKSGLNLSYGGFKKYDRHPFHFKHFFASDQPKIADTFNGNFVLIPKKVSEILGPIDGKFAHAYADIDYGLRATKMQILNVVIPGFLGICENHEPEMLKNLFVSLRNLGKEKNLPIKSQIRFLLRHGNYLWPIYFFSPYISTIKKALRN